MDTTLDLVRAYTQAHGGSANKAARHMDVSTTVYAEWLKGKDFPSEERVESMARAIGIDPQLALVILRRDRAKSDNVRRVWQRIADALAVFVLSAGTAALVAAPSPAQARVDNKKFVVIDPLEATRARAPIGLTEIHIAQLIGVWIARLARRLIGALAPMPATATP